MNDQNKTHRYAFLLGSHPALSAAEAWGMVAKLGYQPRRQAISHQYLLVDLSRELPAQFLEQLGGTIKIARVLGEQATPWQADDIWRLVAGRGTAKFTLGLSGLGMSMSEIGQLGRDLKARAKEEKTKLRFITPHGRATTLNAAQVIFNDLLQPPNREFIITQGGTSHFLLETVQVQDIARYELRDTDRPVRDARVGMLPPKLAQILLNLAVSTLSPATTSLPPAILDPFCGLGTILQEGWLMGHTMVGMDSNARTLEAARANVTWVMNQFKRNHPAPQYRTHDVRHPFPNFWHNTFDAIVTEPFLGRPLHSPLPHQQAARYFHKLADLYFAFFTNARPVLKTHGALLSVFPAVRTSGPSGSFSLLPTDFLDAVKKLGYIPKQLSYPAVADFFPPSPRQSLIYSRPDAFVGREITLWEKH